MKQSHYLCLDRTSTQSILNEILTFFEKKSMIPYDDFILHEDITFFDSPNLRLYRSGGHCSITESKNLSNPENIRIPTLEYRRGKKTPTRRILSENADFNMEEISKIMSFNNDLIQTLHMQSQTHRILLTHLGNKKTTPYFDFSIKEISVVSPKIQTPVDAVIVSLIDRTDLYYDRFTSSRLSFDIDHCLQAFDDLLDSIDLIKISSHNYGELLDLTRTHSKTSMHLETNNADEME